MDLRDIIAGLGWLILGNLAFYLLYPLYGSVINGLGLATVGEFGLTNIMISIGWGGYILMWVLVGAVLPIYLLIKGSSAN